MAIKTLYSVLGLDSTASYDDIENAFKRLKLQHPKAELDADQDTRTRFLAAERAYQTLRDPDTRAAYDQRISKIGAQTVTAPAGSPSRTCRSALSCAPTVTACPTASRAKWR